VRPPRSRRILALVVLSCALGVSPVHAVDTLTLHTVPAFHKQNASYVLDPARHRLVVAGGSNSKPSAYVHVLDYSYPEHWSAPPVLGAPPGFVTDVPGIYDPLRDRMIVLKDSTMWSLTLGDPMTWTHLTPGGTAPANLVGAQVVYDEKRDRLVGLSAAGTNPETWTLSLGASPAWATVPTLGPLPSPRVFGAAAYDRIGDRMVITGGSDLTGEVNNTLQLTLGGSPSWSLLPTAGTPPPASSKFPFAYDAGGRRLLVLGGSSNYLRSLDLATATWAQLTSSQIPDRTGAAAGWDSASAVMVVAGGAAQNDAWIFDTTWRQLVVGGIQSANYAGYDPARHRFAAIVTGRPAFFSTADSTWSPAGPGLFRNVHFYSEFYDAGRNLLGAFSNDSLFTIHPNVDAAWTARALSGAIPPIDYPGTTWLDAPNQRVLVFGGQGYGSFGAAGSPGLFGLDYANAIWTLLQPTTPLGIRSTAPIHDVRRNRLLFYGGALLRRSSPPDAAGDLWSFDLATGSWTGLTAGGASPGVRYDFPAAYDSLRDRALIFGGITYGHPLRGAWYLEFGTADSAGTWRRNDPVAAAIPDYPGLDGAIDPGLDRFFVPYPTQYDELEWGPTQPPLLAACPPSAPWTPGASLALTFHVKQATTVHTGYAWSLSSQRDWPGFPLQGYQQLNDTSVVAIEVGVPVPDSVTMGVDTLTFTITDGLIADSCRVAIGDAASPVPWAFLRSLVRAGHVALSWWTSERGEAVIERRSTDGAWELRGSVPVSGDGSVRYDDDAVEPGARYAYRAGIGGSWSEETWIEIPAAALAFARDGLVSRGTLAVSFTLPSATPAQLEAFDVAGRRVAAHEVGGAGEHTLELAPAGALRRGVYFLRLSQGGVRVNARAVVLGGQ
jgi:hypothetical protein